MANRKKSGTLFCFDNTKFSHFLNENYGGDILVFGKTKDITEMINDKQKVKFFDIDYCYEYDYENFEENIGLVVVNGDPYQTEYIINNIKNFDVTIITVTTDIKTLDYISGDVFMVLFDKTKITKNELLNLLIDTIIKIFLSSIFYHIFLDFDFSIDFFSMPNHCILSRIMGYKTRCKNIINISYFDIELKKIFVYFLLDYYKNSISQKDIMSIKKIIKSIDSDLINADYDFEFLYKLFTKILHFS